MSEIVALIVGIEKYNQKNWDVSGPRNNAIEIARFLVGIGVHPANIFLFINEKQIDVSCKGDDSQSLELTALGVTISPPTRETIDTRFNTLARERTPLSRLFFYWSGHGYADYNGDRLLICSDYTAEEFPNRIFNASNRLRRLRSANYRCFSEQVFLADVCAKNVALKFGTDEVPLTGIQSEVRQLAFFATQEGSYANGDFSAIALDVLKSLTEWPNPNLLYGRLLAALEAAEVEPFIVSAYCGQQQIESKRVGRVGRDPATRPSLFLAPPRPAFDLIGRDVEVTVIKARLVGGNQVAALHGLPGAGKTAIAVQVANDTEVHETHTDGILWIGLGKHCDVISRLGVWAKALGVPEESMSKLTRAEDWATAIHSAIGTRRMLLVIDDVWEARDAQAFMIGGPNCSTLVTTRFPAIAAELSVSRPIVIPELPPEYGLAFLKQYVPTLVERDLDVARRLVFAVGALPLALLLIAKRLQRANQAGGDRRLRAEIGRLENAENRLRLEGWQPVIGRHPSFPDSATVSLSAVINLSISALSVDGRNALRGLALFPPKPNSFSEASALRVVGENSAQLDELLDSGLLELSDSGRYWIHQTIRDASTAQELLPASLFGAASYFLEFVRQRRDDDAQLELEIQNIAAVLDAAIDHDLLREALSITTDLYSFLGRRGLFSIGAVYAERAAAVARRLADKESLVVALLNVGRFNDCNGDYLRADRAYEEGSSEAKRLNDKLPHKYDIEGNLS